MNDTISKTALVIMASKWLRLQKMKNQVIYGQLLLSK